MSKPPKQKRKKKEAPCPFRKSRAALWQVNRPPFPRGQNQKTLRQFLLISQKARSKHKKSFPANISTLGTTPSKSKYSGTVAQKFRIFDIKNPKQSDFQISEQNEQEVNVWLGGYNPITNHQKWKPQITPQTTITNNTFGPWHRSCCFLLKPQTPSVAPFIHHSMDFIEVLLGILWVFKAHIDVCVSETLNALMGLDGGNRDYQHLPARTYVQNIGIS